MKRITLLLVLICVSLVLMADTHLTVTVTNPLREARSDQPVVLSLAAYGEVRTALVTLDGREIPCQLDDTDQDERMDELCFLADFQGKGTQTYQVTLSPEGELREYPARVYAEMLVRNGKVKEKNKQDNYLQSMTATKDCAFPYNILHHHGVAFESELNCIRIYFDARQTLDLYGKFQKRLELRETQFYTDDEQKRQGYGDDVLWVGTTFGLGAFRGWNGSAPTLLDDVLFRTQRVISYGPLRTIVEVDDKGWLADPAKPRIHMTLRYIQYAGHRDTEVQVRFRQDVSDRLFSTGIINVKGSEEFTDHKGLRGCWGTDYPSSDTVKWKRETVGLGICIPRKYIREELPKDKDNYPYVIGTGTRLTYAVAYTSDNETFGYHSAPAWFSWLKAWKKELENPVEVEVRRK